MFGKSKQFNHNASTVWEAVGVDKDEFFKKVKKVNLKSRDCSKISQEVENLISSGMTSVEIALALALMKRENPSKEEVESRKEELDMLEKKAEKIIKKLDSKLSKTGS